MNELPGLVPPQAIELERGILGQLLIEKDAYESVAMLLSQEVFYNEAHGKIFDAICTLHQRNVGIDLLTVSNELKKRKQLDEIGGAHYLASLTNAMASTLHIETHCRILAEKYLYRKIIKSSQELMKLSYDQVIDVGDVINKMKKEIDSIEAFIFRNRKNTDIREQVYETLKEAEKRQEFQLKGISTGIKTPLTDLTLMTGGWQKQDLIIIAARPSMGKTAVVLSCIAKALEENETVVFFSLEMSANRIIDRMILGRTDVNAENYRAGFISSQDWKELERSGSWLMDKNFILDDTAGASLDYVKTTCRMINRKKKIGLIVLDYLGLCRSEGDDRKKNRNDQVSLNTKAAKELAKELDCPFIMLSQLNRNSESTQNKKPQLSDLKESGAIEEDADVVGFIYRPAYYGIMETNGDSTYGMGEIIIAKHRNGPVGTVKFRHNEAMTKIMNYSAEQEMNENVKTLQFADDTKQPF